MSGRFANLEFGDEQHDSLEVQQGELTTERSSQEFLSRADEEYRWGYFDKALRLYTRSLQEDRAAIPAWVGQVQMLVQLDECHEANIWSDKALELFRNNSELLAAKAQACVRLHDHKTGLACSDASLQASGSSPWRWIVRGEVLLAKGDRHSEECFQKALTEAASDWFDRVIVARIYMFYQRATNAMCYLKEAVESEPGHGYIWFLMGDCQRALALDAAARRSYQRCLELRPDYREADRAMSSLARGRSFLSWMKGVSRRWRGQ